MYYLALASGQASNIRPTSTATISTALFSNIEDPVRAFNIQDWAWYRPLPRKEDLVIRHNEPFLHKCLNCEVKWYEFDPVVKHPRCFCCGKFVKRVDHKVYISHWDLADGP
jgi:hypothetical protein